MTADEIKAILQKRHSNLWRWICVTELQTTTSIYRSRRIIDVFAMALIQSLNNYERIAYEIKVSRADWLKELKNPRKKAAAMSLSDRFFFVLAHGIYKKGDLPRDDCGILEITPEKQIKLIRRAKRRKVKPMPPGFIAALARRIKQENQ